jgi:hypothetical protein
MNPSSDVSVGGVRVVVVDPGNMTRYVLVLSQLPLEACRVLGCDEGSFLVAVPNLRTRTMFFSPRHGTSAIYVREKLDVSWGDAEQIASVLNIAQSSADPVIA